MGSQNKGPKTDGDSLAISSHIIKDHGGHIEAISEEGNGTTFHIHPPVSQ